MSTSLSEIKQCLSRMLQLYGYAACRETLYILADHYISTNKYEDMKDFMSKLNYAMIFEARAPSAVISPDLAHRLMQLMCKSGQDQSDTTRTQDNTPPTSVARDQAQVPADLSVKIKNVDFQAVSKCLDNLMSSPLPEQQSQELANLRAAHSGDFVIHYNYLFKRLSAMPVFSGDFKLTQLDDLTASSQPTIRCICFGLLIKDISKIDGYLLIDSTGRVPLRVKLETSYRNRLAYLNCIVLVEGVYVNPDDVLYAANIGLPPILLDPIPHKSLACSLDKMVVILKEPFLDDDEVVKDLDQLFSGYDTMEDPPTLFILIGNFTRERYDDSTFRIHTKKLTRILRTCGNLKGSNFVFVPGEHDSVPNFQEENPSLKPVIMPKPPMTKQQFPVGTLENIYFATNPAHIYIGDRLITVVSHSYIKELHKNLLHDVSDDREELFEAMRQIILSNGHLTAGISKSFNSEMNLWHRPDLLILADSGAFGNRYDCSLSKSDDTSFATMLSFARQASQFKVYYVRTGELEDSQISNEAF